MTVLEGSGLVYPGPWEGATWVDPWPGLVDPWPGVHLLVGHARIPNVLPSRALYPGYYPSPPLPGYTPPTEHPVTRGDQLTVWPAEVNA